MLWQTAYAELVFSEVLWPDFRAADDRLPHRLPARERRSGWLGRRSSVTLPFLLRLPTTRTRPLCVAADTPAGPVERVRKQTLHPGRIWTRTVAPLGWEVGMGRCASRSGSTHPQGWFTRVRVWRPWRRSCSSSSGSSGSSRPGAPLISAASSAPVPFASGGSLAWRAPSFCSRRCAHYAHLWTASVRDGGLLRCGASWCRHLCGGCGCAGSGEDPGATQGLPRPPRDTSRPRGQPGQFAGGSAFGSSSSAERASSSERPRWTKTKPIAPTKPPAKPSQVLFGLTSG